jgi:diadenosine tetraphosphate (Ap4A) HIT family hydrolase
MTSTATLTSRPGNPSSLQKIEAACDLCKEFSGESETFFRTLYPDFGSTRIGISTDNFVAIPSISPIVPGHTLILPKEHHFSFCTLDPGTYLELTSIVNRATISLDNDLPLFIYEHGVSFGYSENCGVSHAHLHLLPLELLLHPSVGIPCGVSLGEAFAYINVLAPKSYLLSGSQGTFRLAAVADNENIPEALSSQYMRRLLCKSTNNLAASNWRNASPGDYSVIETIQALRS